jgi:predicted transcriptional regulator YheO
VVEPTIYSVVNGKISDHTITYQITTFFERIEDAVERIEDKSIQSYKYDVEKARLVKVEET